MNRQFDVHRVTKFVELATYDKWPPTPIKTPKHEPLKYAEYDVRNKKILARKEIRLDGPIPTVEMYLYTISRACFALTPNQLRYDYSHKNLKARPIRLNPMRYNISRAFFRAQSVFVRNPNQMRYDLLGLR